MPNWSSLLKLYFVGGLPEWSFRRHQSVALCFVFYAWPGYALLTSQFANSKAFEVVRACIFR